MSVTTVAKASQPTYHSGPSGGAVRVHFLHLQTELALFQSKAELCCLLLLLPFLSAAARKTGTLAILLAGAGAPVLRLLLLLLLLGMEGVVGAVVGGLTERDQAPGDPGRGPVHSCAS